MSKKNLQICELDVDRQVGRKIFIERTIRVCDWDLLIYLKVSPEPGSGEIIVVKKLTIRIFVYIRFFGIQVAR